MQVNLVKAASRVKASQLVMTVFVEYVLCKIMMVAFENPQGGRAPALYISENHESEHVMCKCRTR